MQLSSAGSNCRTIVGRDIAVAALYGSTKAGSSAGRSKVPAWFKGFYSTALPIIATRIWNGSVDDLMDLSEVEVE